nr:HAD family hydrolase [Petrachloros mirabilis]
MVLSPRSTVDGELRSRLMIFCDLDGPLIDVSHRYYKTYQLAVAETQADFRNRGRSLQLTLLSQPQFWHMKQERLPDTDIAYCSGLRHNQIDAFLAHVHRIVNQPILLGEDRLQPGVSSAISRLHAHGARLTVITLRAQPQAVQLLQQYRLLQWFDQVHGTADEYAAYQNYAAVKAQLLQAAIAEDTQFSSRDQVWMIGDTEADVLAAQALDIPAIALTCGIRSRAYLEHLQPTTVQENLVAATQYLLQHAHSP